MPSRSDVETLRAANTELSRLLDAELVDFFASLGNAAPESVRDALLDFMPALVAEYGDVAAVVSAEWFEQVYGSTARLATPVAAEAVEQGVRFAAGHLWTPEPSAIVGLLSTQLDKWVKQPGRDTIARSAERDGLHWARVPSGAKTCAWCLVLASRDAVYLTERSATKGANGSDYHGKCDCVAVPMESIDDYPDGYDPTGMYDTYMAARSAAGSNDIKDIAAELRRRNPDLVTDAVHEH
ncbi:conserved hypothetical protein [Citricoccus sp. K5]|nr:conserved hypothetical protein [Citricoccus sp. K5]